MTDDRLRPTLEGIWNGFRDALAAYRLADVPRYVDVPADAPVPTREQARDFAAFLPDLRKARFLKLETDGDLAGYFAQTALDHEGAVEVTVIRFGREGASWKLLPAPHTINSYSTDDPVTPEDLLGREASLKLHPPEASPQTPE